MSFWLNESGRDQVFLIDGFREIIPHQYGVTDYFTTRFKSNPALSRDMTRFKDFKSASDARTDGRAVLYRSGALGDVLMMFALAGSMNDAVCSFDRNRFSEFSCRYHPDMDNRVGIILDGEVERDHTDFIVPPKHRIDMMADAIGIEAGDVRWELPFVLQDVAMPKLDVLFQCGGSTRMKQLHPSILRPAISRVVTMGFNVGLLGDRVDFVAPKGVEDFRGKTNLLELWALIKNARVLVTHDSGPLWIAHFTKTPSVLLCGPTHSEPRLSKHPAKTAFIDLSKMVGCRPCGETGVRCTGIDCMVQIPIREFTDQLEDRIDRML